MRTSLGRFDPLSFLLSSTRGRADMQFEPGAFIFKQGTPAEHIYFLIQGTAKETVTSDHGKFAVMQVVEAGMFFGVDGMERPTVWKTSVEAVTSCAVTSMTLRAMRDLLTRAPRFAALFIVELLDKNAKLQSDKVELLFNNAALRLAKRLLTLAHIVEGETRPIGPEITQEMLAAMLGTTRPRVNYFLNKFHKAGLIVYKPRRGIVVHPSLLQAVLDDNAIFHNEDD